MTNFITVHATFGMNTSSYFVNINNILYVTTGSRDSTYIYFISNDDSETNLCVDESYSWVIAAIGNAQKERYKSNAKKRE